MSNYAKFGFSAFLSLILVFTTSGSPDLDFKEEISFSRDKKIFEHEETVSLGAGSGISVELGAGTVTVETHGRKDVSVKVETWLSGDFTPDEEAEITEASRVSVKKKSRKHLEIACANYEDADDDGEEDLDDIEAVIDISLLVPGDAGIDIDLGIGKVTVSGTGGQIEVEVGVGRVLLDRCRSDLDAELGVGAMDLILGVNHGEVEADVGVGKITLTAGPDIPGDYSAEIGIGVFSETTDEEKDTNLALGGSREWTVGKKGAKVDIEVGMGKIEILK